MNSLFSLLEFQFFKLKILVKKTRFGQRLEEPPLVILDKLILTCPMWPGKYFLPSLGWHSWLSEYVKKFDLDVHVKVFKATIRTNGKIEDAKNFNMFSFTLKDIVYN